MAKRIFERLRGGFDWAITRSPLRQTPRDNVVAVIIKDRAEVEPVQARNLEIGEVGLPKLVDAVVLSLNALAGLMTVKAGLVIRSWAFIVR